MSEMITTQIPGSYITVLFNMTEFDEELRQIDVSIDPSEYLSWILVDFGFPVFTPPWMDRPNLKGLAEIVKRYHERELYPFITSALRDIGYNGQELHVTTRGLAYCAISYNSKE